MSANPSPWYAQGQYASSPKAKNARTITKLESLDGSIVLTPPSGVGDVDASAAAVAGVHKLTSADATALLTPGTGVGTVDISVSLLRGLTGVAPVVNVRDAQWAGGALGNGVHDDAPAFNAAITTARGAVGGLVIVPPGNYYVHTTIGPFASNWLVLLVMPGARIFTDQAIPLVTIGDNGITECAKCAVVGGGLLDCNGHATTGILTNGASAVQDFTCDVRILSAVGSGIELSIGDFLINIFSKIALCTEYGILGHGGNNSLAIGGFITRNLLGGVLLDADGTNQSVNVDFIKNGIIAYNGKFQIGLNYGTTLVSIKPYMELATPILANGEFGAVANELATDRFVKMAMAGGSDPSQIDIEHYGVGQASLCTHPYEVVNSARSLRIDGCQLGVLAAGATAVVAPGAATADDMATWHIGSNEINAVLKPTVTPGGGQGIDASATIVGDDISGVVTFTAGALPIAGVLAFITFVQSFPQKPRYVLTWDATNHNPPGALFGFSNGLQDIRIATDTAPVAGQSYDIMYQRI